MRAISILNDVLGPVMRGPSSSHTAAPYHIARMARALLGEEPATAAFAFDPGGSWAEVYHQQGSDLGFAAGLLGWSLTDERFFRSLDLAAAQGIEIGFSVRSLPFADHPNTVEIRLTGRTGAALYAVAKSIGGGSFVFSQIEKWPVHLTGDAHEVLVLLDRNAQQPVRERLLRDGPALEPISIQERDKLALLEARRPAPLTPETRAELLALPGVHQMWTTPPVFFVHRGEPLFGSAAEMIARSESQGRSLGQVALAYESALLGIPEDEILTATIRRYDVMRQAVQRGLEQDLPPMQLLHPTAHKVYRAEAAGNLAIGGLHTRAAARALAVMHVNGGMGVVCAAPTAGSAGTIPGVLVTLAEELGLGEREVALALLAAGAVGLIVATRATFAAEVGGCQVEIGASGAMAAAAVVEAADGTAREACDAAAISFQNTMGSVCDLVQGIVEVPCHTRNAVAASSAFVCADLILGGYANPVPLDETVDAVYAVGQMLPRELKVTALGGLALAPSAIAMQRLK